MFRYTSPSLSIWIGDRRVMVKVTSSFRLSTVGKRETPPPNARHSLHSHRHKAFSSLLFTPPLCNSRKKSVELTDTVLPTILPPFCSRRFFIYFLSTCYLVDPPLVSVTPLSRRVRRCPGHTTRRSRVTGAPKQKKVLRTSNRSEEKQTEKGELRGKALLFPSLLPFEGGFSSIKQKDGCHTLLQIKDTLTRRGAPRKTKGRSRLAPTTHV